jgi:hypothetical protein
MGVARKFPEISVIQILKFDLKIDLKNIVYKILL